MESLDSKDGMNQINITVLGKSGSGKTATLLKLLTKRFIGEYSSETDKYHFPVSNDYKEYSVTIQDTNEEAAENLENVIKWSHIVVVMFSVTDRSSFNTAEIIVQNITQKCQEEGNKVDINLCLVANKTDLNRFRVVMNEEVLRLTKEVPISYYEINAVDSYVIVENAFLQMIKNFLNDDGSKINSFNPFREKSSSPFSRLGIFNHSNRRLSTRTLLNSATVMIDSKNRRGSVENDQRSKNNDSDINLCSSKTSLNNLFSSSTKRIKSEGLKLFKRPK